MSSNSALMGSHSEAFYFFYYTYHYHPNVVSASVDAALFCTMTLVLLALTLRFGGRFMYTIVVTGAVEVVGYGLRILATQQLLLGPFIASTLLLLMAPIALALVNYIVVAKLLRAADKPVWFLRPNHISKLFLSSDILCFFLQAGGGGLLAVGTESMNKIAMGLVLTGLAIQLLFFGAFSYVAYRIATDPAYDLNRVNALKPVFQGLAITITLLFIRNIYRVVEFSSGVNGYVSTNEWVFNVFETLPIFLAFVFYAIYHFGRLLPDERDGQDKPLWLAQLAAVRAGAADIDLLSHTAGAATATIDLA